MKGFASATLLPAITFVLAAATVDAFAQTGARAGATTTASTAPTASVASATAIPSKAANARKTAATPAPAKPKSKYARMSLGLSLRPAFAAPVVTPAAPPFDLEGSYALSGKGEDGEMYVGTATITKVNGDMYKGSWRVGTHLFAGPCFRDGVTLSCGWAGRGSNANVMAYVVGANNELDGVWFGGNDTKLGQETLPTGVTSLLNIGMYTLVNGTNSDGSAYSGVGVVWGAMGIAHPTYRFDWLINSAPVEGLALASSDPIAVGTIIGVGFADGSSDYGVLMYKIDAANNELVGHWAQSIGNMHSGGQEVATRRASTVTPTSTPLPSPAPLASASSPNRNARLGAP